MEIIKTHLPGLFIIDSKIFKDKRGIFVKVFHRKFFEANNIASDVRESFYSISRKNVIRGMHFQLPPDDHEKFVFCVHGKILDVILDIRKGSPTYGKFYSIELSGRDGLIVYIPKGFAHGFLSLEDNSIVVYMTTKEYSPEKDYGIRWDSFGFNWNVNNPIISPKDRELPLLSEFDSPFVFA